MCEFTIKEEVKNLVYKQKSKTFVVGPIHTIIQEPKSKFRRMA